MAYGHQNWWLAENGMLKVTLTLFVIAMASGAAFGQPTNLAERLLNAGEREFVSIYSKFEKEGDGGLSVLFNELDRKLPPDAKNEDKTALAKRQANAAVVLLRMKQPAKVWHLLKHRPDPTLRSYVIERMGPGGVDPKVLIARFEEEQDVSVKRAILLSLGQFNEKALSLDDRTTFLPKLQEMYPNDADPGLHAATEWLLRTWKQEDLVTRLNKEWAENKIQREQRLERIQKELAADNEKAAPQWYLNGQGQTMVVIPGPVEFLMGSPKPEVGPRDDHLQHKHFINRSFAIASKEVTVEQFFRFHKDHDSFSLFSPTSDCPVNKVSWYEAAAYCNWLNEQEGIPTEQRCYEPNKEGKYSNGMKMAPDSLRRAGYRLPTEAEWEYACRAGAITRYSFGQSEDLLGKYAWFETNSFGISHSVGSLKPNDLGLFDMHGNMLEWCQDLYGPYHDSKTEKDQEESLQDAKLVGFVLRGGSSLYDSSHISSALRLNFQPSSHRAIHGFRLARTLPLDSNVGAIKPTDK